jgi:hypothetical protein
MRGHESFQCVANAKSAIQKQKSMPSHDRLLTILHHRKDKRFWFQDVADPSSIRSRWDV